MEFLEKDSDFIFMPDVLNYDRNENIIEFYTYGYNFDGIYFQQQYNYCLTNEGF